MHHANTISKEQPASRKVAGMITAHTHRNDNHLLLQHEVMKYPQYFSNGYTAVLHQAIGI